MCKSRSDIFSILGFVAARFGSATALSFSTTHLLSVAKREQLEGKITNDDGRREALKFGGQAAAVAIAATIFGSPPARAFQNAIPEAAQYADKPKRRGTPPKDLSVLPRTTEGKDDIITSFGLRTCDGNPNCFSTTGDYELSDRNQKGVDFLIEPWKPSADEKLPLTAVADSVQAYSPGAGGIDGGGFSVEKSTDTYLYVRFESLKKGYIDDVEFATGGANGTILVRSASRLGYTDFGVNAIRLNAIAALLRKRGWVISEITPDTHRDYWLAANDAREATFDSSRRQLAGGDDTK